MLSAEDWYRSARTLEFAGHAISHRLAGAGPPDVTLIHGFPTSSWDWARVAAELEGEARVVTFDLLGQGRSAKPAGHPYSVLEQADILGAVWAAAGVERTLVLAHDLGATVAQELLARRAHGTLPVELTGVVLLNGGLYPELHRPTDGQAALTDPEHGPAVAKLMDEALFRRALLETFGEATRPSDSELAEHWAILAHADGQLRMPEILAYIEQRRRYRERWVGALEGTEVPLRFVWGDQDPISGAHVAARLRERFPAEVIDEHPEAGHWPALEVPGAVVAAARALLTGG